MIVYAPSFAGLVQALKISLISDLYVITSNKQVCLFCEEFDIAYTDLKLLKPKRIKEFISQKIFLQKISKNIRGQQILFCFYSFDLLGLYLMYLLKENNTVYFENKDHIYPQKRFFSKTRSYYFHYLDLFVVWIMINFSYRYFFISEQSFFIGIPPKKLKKKFHTLNEKFNFSVFHANKSVITRNYNIQNHSIIFIDEGSDLFSIGNELVEWLETNFGSNRLLIKPHPNYKLSNENLLKYKQLKKNIPLELILKEEIILIGVSSTVLLDETINCKKFSLINLVDWRSENDKRNAIRIISKLNNNNQIEIINTMKIK